jgi:hypothetical protein
MHEAGQISQIPIRPARSVPAIVIAVFWFLTSFLFFALGIFFDLLGHEIMGILTFFLAISLARGARWSFWCSTILLALCVGMPIFQLQSPGYRTSQSETTLWGSLAISLVMLVLHEFKTALAWFGIKGEKKHYVRFWLIVGAFVFMGQMTLPILRALGDWMRS